MYLCWDLNTPYHRITQATISIENNIKFSRQESGLIPITNIDIGSDKLNIGIKVGVPGFVKDEISGLTKEAKIFRNYNIINGGNINVPYINAKLSDELYEKLNAEGVISLNEKYSFVGGTKIYKINFTGIKSANKRILKSLSMTEIVDNLKTIADLKCKQWAINQLIKEVVGDKEKVEFASNLSIEEIETRKLLRIDEFGIYKPESTEKDNTSPFEIYPAIYMSWDIKFSDKKVKEQYLTNIRNMFTKITVGDTKIYDQLSKMLEETRKDMRSREFKVNCVRIASAIMNKSPFIWEVGLEKDKTTTDKVLNRNMIVGGKVNQCKKVVGEDIIEQKKWVQLVKCN